MSDHKHSASCYTIAGGTTCGFQDLSPIYTAADLTAERQGDPPKSEVQLALEELRELLPDLDFLIEHRLGPNSETYQITIWKWEPPSDIPCQYNEKSGTLAEAMEKVRQWKAEQEGKL